MRSLNLATIAFAGGILISGIAAAQDQRVSGFPDDPSHSGSNSYAFTVNGVGRWYVITGDRVMANTMAAKIELNVLEHKRNPALGWINFYADCAPDAMVSFHGGTKGCPVHDID